VEHTIETGSRRPSLVAAPSRLLVVDDDQDQLDSLQLALQQQGHQVTATTSAAVALRKVGEEDFDAVLTDLGMAEMNGLDFCERVLGVRSGMPVIVVTGRGHLEAAISALRAGAYDFVTKPVDAQILGHCVARALQHRRLHDEVRRLQAAVAGGAAPGGLVGDSTSMRAVYALVERVAGSEASVLIRGETGTGKELIARAIHANSPRKGGPFVALNCAAVPPALLESELFGHARGAFTDAKSARTGLFLEASGGTLFLDEIGELPLEMQPKLLRALQERTVRPVGANVELPFDVRIITATNRDLEFEIFEKRFREDLFYRINVVNVDLPPLRDRAGDILILAQHFLTRFSKRAIALSDSVAGKLMEYTWPGNVRELENCMERSVALARFDHLSIEDLPEKIRGYRSDRIVVSAENASEVVTLDELERRYIERVLVIAGNSRSKAATMLGLDRRTLYRRIERYTAAALQGADGVRPVVSGE
jgi:two-component system response regulator HydG